MGFATIDNSKSVRSTNLIFAHKTDIGATIEKMQKTKFQNFGVNGFGQMTCVTLRDAPQGKLLGLVESRVFTILLGRVRVCTTSKYEFKIR